MALSKTKQQTLARTTAPPVAEKRPPAPERPVALQQALPARTIAPGLPTVGRAQSGLALQRSVGNARVGQLLRQTAPPLAQRITAAQDSGGTPLPPGDRARLEPALGTDLGGVRLHTDGEANHLSQAVGATAFTSGQDIFFRAGAYEPGTATGQQRLAHEVVHTVQQARGPVAATRTAGGVAISDPGDPFEQAATHTADRLTASPAQAAETREDVSIGIPSTPSVTGMAIQRQDDDSQLVSVASPTEEPLMSVASPAEEPLVSQPETVAAPVSAAATPVAAPTPEPIAKALASRDPADVKDITDISSATTAQKLELIKILTYQTWVGPSDESKLEELWGSFGDDLVSIASQPVNWVMWLHGLDAGAELDDLSQVEWLRIGFRRDVKETVAGYLLRNRELVLSEMGRLGLPTEEMSAPEPSGEQADELQRMQLAAAAIARLQKAQEEARELYVGYELSTRFWGGEAHDSWMPVKFSPFAPPQFASATGSFFIPIAFPAKITPYDQVKEPYDKASAAITTLLARHPTLYAVSREGKSAVTAGFAGIASPAEAREQLAVATRKLLQDIDKTRRMLDAGDLDPLDLTPVHEQLLAGMPAPSGRTWTQTLPAWVVREMVKDHEFYRALTRLGLQTASAALFMLAPFTGGASLYVMLAGLAVTGAQLAMSAEHYQTLAQAAKTSVAPGTEIVSQAKVEEAKLLMEADAIAFALAALAVGVAVAAKVIGSIKGPAPNQGTPQPKVTDPKAFGVEIAKSLKGQQKGKFFVVSEQITAAKLAQADAVTAAEAATVEMGNRLTKQVLPDGSVGLLSVQAGPNQPILVVRPDGSMFYASADLAVNPANLEFTVSNIQPRKP